MGFNFETPENFLTKIKEDITIYKSDKMTLLIQQKVDMSSYDEINMRVILNSINSNIIYTLDKLNHEIKVNSEYKCINMAKRLIKDRKSNSEYKMGFMKGILSVSNDNKNILIMNLLGIIIPDDKTDCCIIRALFSCDSNTSEKEKLFMNILESVERIDDNE